MSIVFSLAFWTTLSFKPLGSHFCVIKISCGAHYIIVLKATILNYLYILRYNTSSNCQENAYFPHHLAEFIIKTIIDKSAELPRNLY